MSDHIDNELPEELTLRVHNDYKSRVQDGRWLSVDGECYVITGFEEGSEDDPYYKLFLKRQDETPDDQEGYLGKFLRGSDDVSFASH